MQNIMAKYFFIIILLITSAFPLEKSYILLDSLVCVNSKINATFGLSDTSIEKGDTLVYTVNISQIGTTYVIEPPLPPQTLGLSFLYTQTIAQRKRIKEGFRSNTIFKLVFVGRTEGVATIERTKIKYLNKTVKKPEYIYTKDCNIKILKKKENIANAILFKGVIILFLLAALTYKYFTVIKKRKNNISKAQKTPKEKAYEYFNKARSSLINGEVQGYYKEIGNALRVYIEQKENIYLNNVDELISYIEASSMGSEEKESIIGICKTCKEMRFSGVKPEEYEVANFESKIKKVLV